MANPAIAFGINSWTNPIPSMFACREFIFIMVCQAVYLVSQSGLNVKKIEAVFIKTLIIDAVNYVVVYSVST